MPFRVKTAPSEEPVTLQEAKDQLNLETDEDDDLLTTAISAARGYAEAFCARGIVTQTVEFKLDRFPSRGSGAYAFHSCGFLACEPCRACQLFIDLPFGALAETPNLSVKYINEAGSETTLAVTTDYTIDALSLPPRVHLAYGKSWPTARAQWDAVTVQYDVGAEPEDVPAGFKQAILLLVASMYEQRTPEVTGSIVAKVGLTVEALLAPLKVYTL